MGEQLLFSCVALPAFFGLACYVLPKRLAGAAALIGLPGAFATFLLCALLPGMKGAELRIPWLSVGGFDVSLSMRVGALSGFAAAFIGLFGLLIACFSLPYMREHRFQARYYAFTFWALAGAIGATLADHLIFFLIAWEVVTLMLYLLVSLGREPAAKAGAKAFVLLGFADAALLLGIVFLWKLTGTMSIGELAAIGAGTVAGKALPTTAGLGAVAFLLMFAGVVAKVGAVPLHTWVPSSAQAAPLPVMALLPASLDKLLGICLLARVALQFFVMTPTLGLVVMIVGAATVLSAVLMAMVQHDLRKLVACQAVSSIGYAVLGLGTGCVVGAVGGCFHMLSCAIYSSCLFLMAGAVRNRTGTTELERLGGLARAMPATFVAGAIAALAISGVPPLNGFASKWMVYQGVLATKSSLAPLLLIAAVFGSALTLASFVKVIHSLFLGRPSDHVAGLAPGKVPVLMVLPMAVLAALCIVFGVFVQLPIGQWIAPSVSEVAPGLLPAGAAVSYGLGVWQASQATMLLLVGLVLGLLFYAIGRIGKARVARPFLGGELLGTDDVRVPGTGFYETVRGLPLLSGMFRDAEEEVYDVYHLGGRYGGTLVQHLRNLHTGVLAVYVAWCAIGLAAVLFYLLPI